MNLQLRKFDPSKIADDRVCVLIGKRNTGKSFLTRHLMSFKKHIPSGVVLSGTEEGNGWYGKFVPDLFIYPDFDKEAIERVIERQKKLVKTGRKQNVFMILDDVMYDTKNLRETCIRQIFMNGRHWGIFFMLCMQYCMDIQPALRSNIDYVFVLRENILQNREKLWKNFFGVIPTFDMFNKIMDAVTEDFGCLVLDNTQRSNRITDCVYWYKAPPHKPFRLGSSTMWAMHKKMYNPKYDSESQVDPKKATKKTALTVKKVR